MRAHFRRARRILVFAFGFYLLVQFVSQAALELRFPLAVRLGPFTAVVFFHRSPGSSSRAEGD